MTDHYCPDCGHRLYIEQSDDTLYCLLCAEEAEMAERKEAR